MKVGDRVAFVRKVTLGRGGAEFMPGERATVVEIEPGGKVWIRSDIDDLRYSHYPCHLQVVR